MSHFEERKERECLNCGTETIGRYCHQCGQENVEPKETFWHLVTHFFNDITHFDGKFFSTLKLLLFKPGFLPSEYVKGKRASYLNPIRMYIFTSAIFFLAFYSIKKANGEGVKDNFSVNGKAMKEINEMDSVTFAQFTSEINKEDHHDSIPMTREEFKIYVDTVLSTEGIHLTPRHYKSKEEYDSLLASGVKKHNWLERHFIYKEIELNTKYHNNAKEIFKAFQEKFFHSFPQILFVSLPLTGLVLMLLYIRRKQYYYVSHMIYAVHLYCATLIIILMGLFINWLLQKLHFNSLAAVFVISALATLFYWYKAQRNFYGQKRAKTIFKFILFVLLFDFMMIIPFLLFFILSAYSI